MDAGDHVLAPQHADAMGRAGEAHLEAGVAREEHLVAGLDRASRPGRRPRRCRCGTARPRSPARSGRSAARDSSSGSRTMWSSSGSSVTSVIGCPSSMRSTILAACASAATTSRSRTRTSSSSPSRGLTKGDLVALLPRRRRPRAPPPAPPAVPHEAVPERRRGRVLPPEARAREPSRRTSTRCFVQFPSGHSTVFAIVDNAAALAWVANLGCIELHTWHSRVPEIERPDYLLIDLDPTTRRPVAVRARDRARRARGDGRARAALVPEDVGRDRPAHPRADPARAAVPRGAPASRRRSRRRSSGASATSASRRRRGASPTASASSSTSARTRATARSRRRTRCGRRPTRASRRRSAGTRSPTSSRRRSRSRRCATRIAAVGDPMRGMWRRPPRSAPRFARLGLEPPRDAVTRPYTPLRDAGVRWRDAPWSSSRRASSPRSCSPARRSRLAVVRYGIQDDAWLRFGPGTLEQRLDRLDALGVDARPRERRLERGRAARAAPTTGAATTRSSTACTTRGIEPLLTLYGDAALGERRPRLELGADERRDFARVRAPRRRCATRSCSAGSIWNEPNQRRWLQPTTPAVYVQQLLNPAYAAIHARVPGALVAGGVTAPRGSTGGVSPVAWIAGMAPRARTARRLRAQPVPAQPGARRRSAAAATTATTITMATLERLLARRAAGVRRAHAHLADRVRLPDEPARPAASASRRRRRRATSARPRCARTSRRASTCSIQYLIQDEPDLARWQSGVLHRAAASRSPRTTALRFPLAQRSRHGAHDDALGPDPPAARRRRRYRLQQYAAARWNSVGAHRAHDRARLLHAHRPRRRRRAASASGRRADGRSSGLVVGRRSSRPRRVSAERAATRRPARSGRAAGAARATCSRAGSLSSRQRRNFVPWRKRLPCTLS